MRRLSLISIAVFVLFVFLGIATVSVQAAILNITVTDARTGNKLNNVSITVKPEDGDAAEGVSDTNGTLGFADLAAGVYTITVFSQGYAIKVLENVEFSADETKSVEISLSSEVIELDKISITASRRKEKVLEARLMVLMKKTTTSTR